MEKFIFKSKYRDDQVSLSKPTITPNPDGSRTVEGGDIVQFSHNTFTTFDEARAERLRKAIADRQEKGTPLHIFETTKDEPTKGPATRKGVKGSKG